MVITWLAHQYIYPSGQALAQLIGRRRHAEGVNEPVFAEALAV